MRFLAPKEMPFYYPEIFGFDILVYLYQKVLAMLTTGSAQPALPETVHL